MSIRGATRDDGSFIGYDYDRQMWIDTSPNAERDATKKPGSACNPLPGLSQSRATEAGLPVNA